MKVTTDGCLFGAIVAGAFADAKNISVLDIGTGTGLLALMLAQKNITAIIDAVELDDDAAAQAKQNFAESKYANQIILHHADIKQFSAIKKYDLIICNPPFYEDDLKSAGEKRNKALHSTALLQNELIIIAENLLNKKGIVAVLLPAKRTAGFLNIAIHHGLHCRKNYAVKQTENHSTFRNIVFLSKEKTEPASEEIIIKNGEKYGSRFIELLQDYYLYL